MIKKCINSKTRCIGYKYVQIYTEIMTALKPKMTHFKSVKISKFLKKKKIIIKKKDYGTVPFAQYHR
jgi:hypothetical protein